MYRSIQSPRDWFISRHGLGSEPLGNADRLQQIQGVDRLAARDVGFDPGHDLTKLLAYYLEDQRNHKSFDLCCNSIFSYVRWVNENGGAKVGHGSGGMSLLRAV